MKRCAYSGERVDDTMAILVGSIERGSATPALVYACCTCVAVLKLMPLSKHPKGSDGRPRRADGQPVLATGPAPVRVHYGERASWPGRSCAPAARSPSWPGRSGRSARSRAPWRTWSSSTAAGALGVEPGCRRDGIGRRQPTARTPLVPRPGRAGLFSA